MSAKKIKNIKQKMAKGNALLETINRSIRTRIITMLVSVLLIVLSFRLHGVLRALPLIINAAYLSWAWRDLLALSETKKEINTGLAVHRQNLKKLNG